MGLFKKSVLVIYIILFHCSLIQAADEYRGDEFDNIASEEVIHNFVEPKGGEQFSADDYLDIFDETFGEKEGKVSETYL